MTPPPCSCPCSCPGAGTRVGRGAPAAAPTRRRLLGATALATALLGGCGGLSGRPSGRSGLPEGDRLIDLRSGRDIPLDRLLDELRHSHYGLLGELHDNPWHHQRRGLLIGRLGGGGAMVVAEQLSLGHAVGLEGELLPALQAAGFDARAWGWPLHEPLFAALRQARLPLQGGNLPPAEARRVAREGAAALRPELAALLQQAPLAGADEARLDSDLVSSHCGHLPPARLPAMRLAQRARDAAMALALRHSGGRPAVLLAGNGHVRGDYGVAHLLRALAPQARITNLLFGEPGDEAAALATPLAAPVGSHLWITPAPRRDDPCAKPDAPRQAAAPGQPQPAPSASATR